LAQLGNFLFLRACQTGVRHRPILITVPVTGVRHRPILTTVPITGLRHRPIVMTVPINFYINLP